MANLVAKTMLSGALAAASAASAWPQSLPDLPLFSGESVFLDPYNELLDQLAPKKFAASVFTVAQVIGVDLQFGPPLTDLDAYTATLAELSGQVKRTVDPMSAYAFVPGARMLRVWEVPTSSANK